MKKLTKMEMLDIVTFIDNAKETDQFELRGGLLKINLSPACIDGSCPGKDLVQVTRTDTGNSISGVFEGRNEGIPYEEELIQLIDDLIEYNEDDGDPMNDWKWDKYYEEEDYTDWEKMRSPRHRYRFINLEMLRPDHYQSDAVYTFRVQEGKETEALDKAQLTVDEGKAKRYWVSQEKELFGEYFRPVEVEFSDGTKYDSNVYYASNYGRIWEENIDTEHFFNFRNGETLVTDCYNKVELDGTEYNVLDLYLGHKCISIQNDLS